MSAKVQFSWKNQKGLGLALVFYGWSILFLIPAFFHSYFVLHLTAIFSDMLLYIGVILAFTPVIGGIIATIYENLYDPVKDKFFNVYTLLIISLVVFFFFYSLSVPTIQTIEPFLALPRALEITGWNYFIISLVSGVIGLLILLFYSYRRARKAI